MPVTINGVVENSSTVTVTVTAAGSGTDLSSDGPLPPWALGALGAGLIGIATRRLKKVGSR